MSKYKLSKTDKYIIKHLYFYGYSKDDIYQTLKRANIEIPRQAIREYLSGRLKNKRGIYKNQNNYQDRINEFYDEALHRKQREKKGEPYMTWKEYHQKKQELQDNFLKKVLIGGLNNRLINPGNRKKFEEKYKKLVKWNSFIQAWVSP